MRDCGHKILVVGCRSCIAKTRPRDKMAQVMASDNPADTADLFRKKRDAAKNARDRKKKEAEAEAAEREQRVRADAAMRSKTHRMETCKHENPFNPGPFVCVWCARASDAERAYLRENL